ncbi:5'/3'-nucleotidase SurE [Pseudanabaena sp. PCC 6802]|uniref:5'/3'-nucleotidase SurE n=1 Tax=Pseudanabaena sp. PCC 6802 TaxID=118173 RepID=UPI00034AF80B|nr:5'/3'-nucleotidase SurE [Pseudanabaena sp. PCC 6802]
MLEIQLAKVTEGIEEVLTLILTNDDGIDAPGILALQKAVAGKGVVVAPRDHLSGCGHQVTTASPIHVQQRSPGHFAIAGTPADCVRVAIGHLFENVKLVLSGINEGGNLGADVYISGTVAAVREAALHGIPAIAISHYRAKRKEIDWEYAAYLTTLVLDKLLNLPIEPGTFWNVNLPHLDSNAPEPAIVFCPLSSKPLPIGFRVEGEHLIYAGKYELRDRSPGTDVDVCFSGSIAVTKIKA